jgi:hypothetical protein
LLAQSIPPEALPHPVPASPSRPRVPTPLNREAKVSCPWCGSPYPRNSTVCRHCSPTEMFDVPPADAPVPTVWEYREIAVRLGTKDQPSLAARNQRPWWEVEQHRRAVLEQMQTAREDGWELDGSPDWRCMVVARRARYGPGQGRSRLREEHVEEVVLLRLRRPKQPGGRGSQPVLKVSRPAPIEARLP